MKELEEYRQKLIERLVAAAKDFRAACLAVKDPYKPLEEGGWNGHQVAAHTRDTHKLVYGLRVRRTAAEEKPLFQNFDGEAYMAEHYDAQEPLGPMLDELVASVDELAKMLRGLPGAGWAHESSHETYGGLTLQTWVERDLAHVEEHVEQVGKG